jgi:hypothetical protein
MCSQTTSMPARRPAIAADVTLELTEPQGVIFREASTGAATRTVAGVEGNRRPDSPARELVEFCVLNPTAHGGRDAGGHMVAALSPIFSLTVILWEENVVLALLPKDWGAKSLCDYLRVEHGVHVPDSTDEPSDTGAFLRLAVRPEDQVQRLVDGVCAYAAQKRSSNAA